MDEKEDVCSNSKRRLKFLGFALLAVVIFCIGVSKGLYIQALLGSSEAQFRMSMLEVRDPYKAMKWLRRASDNGHPEAQLFLSMYYKRGTLVPCDKEMAEKLLEKSVKGFKKRAKNGNPEAQYYYGCALLGGSVVDKDVEEAEKMLKTSAERGFAEAQRALGDFYASKKHGRRNVEEAKKWYLKAKKSGYKNIDWKIRALD